MLPAATSAHIAPKVLPIVLTVGGATVAGRSLSRQYNRETIRAQPTPRTQPQPRSRYFELVLESVFA
ncbi:hypothetical protein FVEG_03647 [Fusarium verticillioides 7600]|uniref:Uncharacterized protein n=4 Tax=Fusarium fujikuroi species complex TaxID=171627 RepID=A0A2K0WUR1_GIBNY|nr:hypothetical protein FVEG_03647 [Fusarium verticillioides 7600]KAF4429413.1 hypothetical protein FACUT_9156 [Fusarium acutatum]KAF5712199.1 hypothetical protein FMUND_8621 [Fusarium mundagurra]PNP86028.1 hypothetical protein FNYG_01084 [Fusarium nygamai]RBQ79051.1 hypothetical protein FVER14953_03647 [Fusarium verticillioides]EWG41559.1 hypothetical protein FVEG_03647 [Fusarium verticillioides 7600]